MKTAMKLTTGILAVAFAMAGVGAAPKAAAQTDDIDNARSVAKSLQQKQANDTNAALDAAGVPDPAKLAPVQPAIQPVSAQPSAAKPAPGAPAPAIKPAVIPGAKAAAPAKPAAAKAESKPAAAKSASASAQLEKVSVVPGSDKIQIEISASGAIEPKASKLDSPARILVELPDTSDAAAQSKITVNAGGVKGVRIGMDGKTPPTTSVVIDLEKSLAYELTPGAAGKAILTLHTQGATQTAAKTSSAPAPKSSPVQAQAKSTPAPAKPVAAAPATPLVAKSSPSAAKVQAVAGKPPVVSNLSVAKASTAKTPASAAKSADAKAQDPMKSKTAAPAKAAAAPAPAKVEASKETKAPEAKPADTEKKDEKKAEDKKDSQKPEDKKWAMNGKRDPFFSPVVQQNGPGCSTGKKCLEIGGINLRGVVKSDSGFIAVVTNNLNKAYFLRENDPVFNGYVVKITGDSVTFQETVQDKLGKTFTREVVKKIFTPAV